MIYFILFIVMICFMGKYIYELHQFNHSAELIQLQAPNKSTIQEVISEKSPIIIHNFINKKEELLNITIPELIEKNPGYIIQDKNKNIILSSFNDKKIQQMAVLDNSNMIDDFELSQSLKEINQSFMDNLSCNLKMHLSILKGDYTISLKQMKHNYGIYSQLHGESTFYIINPKHKEDIANKSQSEIKKWAFKINLKPGLILYLPPEWYYMYEVDEESILSYSYCDNYFTWGYNLLR